MVKVKFSGGQKPLVKLEPSVGQETRFGCEIEDCGSGEYQHKESLEFLFVKPLGYRVNDSVEAYTGGDPEILPVT